MSGALRRHATTLVMVALAAGAGLWLTYGESGRPTTTEKEARRDRLVPIWRRDEVTRIEIAAAGGPYTIVREDPGNPDDRAFRLERAGGEKLAADPQAVDELLSSLELATVKRRVAEGSVDRGAMGLDDPRGRLTITMGSSTFRLVLGGKAPAPQDGAYVEVEEHGVAVIASTLADSLAAGADTLRDRTIVPYASSALGRLTLEGEGGRRVLDRAPWPAATGTAFRFEGGGPRVAARPFASLLEALGKVRAEAFVTEGTSLGSPRVTLRLEPREGPPAVIAIGAPCPDRADLVVVERREPTRLVACAPLEVMGPLTKSRDDLIDRGLVAATRDELVELKIVSGGSTLEMARRGAGFFVRTPEEREVGEEAARGFVESLLAARGTLEAAADARLEGAGGLDLRIVSRPPAAGDPERVEVVRLGPSEGGRRWARRDEDGAVLVVEEAAVRSLLSPELVLRDLHVIDVAPEKVREIAVTSGDVTQRVRRSGLGFELVEPKGAGLRADEAWSLALFEAVARLDAVRWVAADEEGAFGLSPARVRLEVMVEDRLGEAASERKVQLALGAPTDDGPFAALLGQKGVFLAPPELEIAARRSLVDRGSFSVKTASLSRVVMRGRAAGRDAPTSLELGRRNGALLPDGASAGDPSATTRAARAREGLDDLTAITAVAVGAAREEHGLASPTLTLELTPVEGAPFRLLIGAADAREGTAVHYARRSDVDAVFVVGASAVRVLLEALP